MNYPPYIIRVLDGRILRINENNRYVFIDDKVPYEWMIEHLNEPDFIKIWNIEEMEKNHFESLIYNNK